MILVIGSPSNAATARVIEALQRRAANFVVLDERFLPSYVIECVGDATSVVTRVRGRDCVGKRPVEAIFVRHDAHARAPRGASTATMRAVRQNIDLLLTSSTCCVVNRPAMAAWNYSKPFQLQCMASAGFQVPRTMTTSHPADALKFLAETSFRVILKGISNAKTVPRLLRMSDVESILTLERCPVQFQAFVEGEDVRVTVVGESTFVSRLDVDHFRSEADPAALVDPDNLRRCVEFTKAEGLLLSGIDFRRSSEGNLVAFELNPFPLFPYYEDPSRPVITEAIVSFLSIQRPAGDFLV